ncbi:nuclear pore membrane glycoprotein 210-like [Salvelinus fontinalis]|uniref:nuclear pore membrane glycoprotein 210-like n=1 Tax=Salvelinus fontinalis TaxID=8038 RepID=UPI002484E76C|nr:nuclear pore membrane glycoprotein 210-like [Salvelinus fontinalis]
MAVLNSKVLCKLLIFCVTIIALSQSTRLNVPKLLLPRSNHNHVNFTLTAEKGCYKWVSSRPQAVVVWPLSPSIPPSILPPSACSQQVLVSAWTLSAPLDTNRGASIIQGQDSVTGHTLRCDVIVDQIKQIQVVTTTRQLFTEDPPLVLSVMALDSGGNTFSSLAGLQFEWRLVKDSETAEIVRFVRFSEAGYSPPHHILSLEEAGQKGDSVLLEGVRSGVVRVRASLSHPDYKWVEPASVSLTVTDRLYLSPSHDAYLLLGSTLSFRVWKSVHDTETEVVLGEGEYELSVERDPNNDDDVITVDQDTGTVTARGLGRTTLSVTHPSLPENSASHLPRCSVFVVEPSYLTLGVEEEDRWVLESGRQYQVTVRVHDQEGHTAHLAQNVVMTVDFSDWLFYVLETSSNSSYHVLETRGAGHTTIQAALFTVLTEDGRALPLIPPIRAEQEVEIYEPLTLQPRLLVFPWQPEGQLYQHHFQVEGGSGAVSWSVSDSDVAVVTIKGEVMAGKRRGQVDIRASDARNPLHTATGQVYVLRPAVVDVLAQRGDCRVGETITLPLAVWGVQEEENQDPPQGSSGPQSLLEVTDCSLINLHVTTSPRGVFTPLPGSVGPGSGFCGGLQLEAVGPGHTLITITVEMEHYNITSMATLAAHSPLKALVSEVVLSLGASCLIVFEGGPQPWPLVPARFHGDAQAEGEGLGVEALSLSEPRRAQQHAYRVTCHALGEQWLVFSCGNSPGPLNQDPSVERSRVRVDCSTPRSLSLSLLPSYSSSPPSIPPSSLSHPCPEPHYPASLLSVSSSRDAVLQLAVFDHRGVQFDNFSSCSVNWLTSNYSLLSLPSHTHMGLADTHTPSGHSKLHGRQVLRAHDLTGTVTITVALTPAQDSWATPLTASVHLRLVEDMLWDKRAITLYNHPDITENLTLVQGSGHFLVRLQDRELANITYLENSNVVQVSPLRPGLSSILAYDLCLTSADPAVTSISVSDITDFQIDFVDIVEVDHSALVRVRVLDSNRQPFLHRYLPLMHLKLTPSSPILTVEPAGPLDSVSVGYRVSSQTVGVVSLHLSAVDSSGSVRTSSHKQLQVYPRFTLQPRSLALTLGSVRQVKWEGGPHPQSSVGFSVSDSHIATVTDTGLVRGVAVGMVKLRGALQTVTQDTGALLTFAQDEVDVEVFNLTGVRIQAPLVKLSVGTEMPVYVMGSDSSQNPFALGSVESGLSFHWNLGKLGVLEIQTRHTQAGVTVSPAHSFSVLVRAWAAGRTSLRVTVQLANHTSASHQQLSDEIQILVYQEMQLAVGTSRSILMSPYSHYALQSNKDTICPVRYALCQCVKGEGLVTVDSQGVLRAGPDTGSALLEVIAMETCGVNQTLLISVRVSPVWFVRLFSVSSLYSVGGGGLPAFPLGWTIRVRALCYDNLGQQFNAHDTLTHITTNRDDLVQVTPDSDSHSFVVQTVSGGLTVLGVQADPTNPSLSDYTPLPVLPAISAPPHTLRPGDTLCFNTPLTGPHGQPGQWNVSSSRVLQIDPKTGAALAKHSGTVVVYYRLEDGQQALREVKVDSPAIPELSPQDDRFLTNWPDAADYTVPVELYTSPVNTAQCSLSQREAIEKKLQPEAELLCSLHFTAPYLQLNTLQAVMVTTPHYDLDTGEYSCRVSVRPQSDSVLHLLSSLSVSVSLSASLRGQSPVPVLPLTALSLPLSGRLVQLPYLPAFHCPVSFLVLSALQPMAEFSVMGTKEVLSALRFHSDSTDVLLSEPSQSDGHLVLSVYISTSWVKSQALPPPANITLSSHLTPQTHVLTVYITVDSEVKIDLIRLQSSWTQLLDFHLILVFAVFAVMATTATLYIGNYLTTIHHHLVHRLSPVECSRTVRFSPWIRPSSPDTERIIRRRNWLWSTR